jgi:hypothetical protein
VGLLSRHMSAPISARSRWIASLASSLCGVGIGTAGHADTERDANRGAPVVSSETIICSSPAEPTISWPGLIQEIRETPVTQIEDGNPPLSLINEDDLEEILRIVPMIDLPDDRR